MNKFELISIQNENFSILFFKLVQLGEEDKEVISIEKDENFPLPNRSLFNVQLYTSSTWEALPLGRYDLHEWEHVSSMKLVDLPYEGHSSGFK